MKTMAQIMEKADSIESVPKQNIAYMNMKYNFNLNAVVELPKLLKKFPVAENQVELVEH